ncbi:MAG: hypothetical protein MUF51_08505, partial [Vicinamibacteria bacterium]|nr:hypothetical protein [Vicinamibacteria bacterium]
MSHRPSFAILFTAVILVVTALLAYDGDLDGSLDVFHEGERLAAVDAYRAGRLPFRDVYIQHGFIEEYVKPLVACRLFGDSVAALRRLSSNTFIYRGILPPLGAIALLLAAAILLRERRWLGLIALLVLIGWCEVTDRHLLGFLVIAAWARHIETGQRGWLAAAGIASGLAAAWSLEVGLYVTAAIFVALVLQACWQPIEGALGRGLLRTVGAYTLGLVLGWAPLILYCLAQGILTDFARNVFIQLFLRGETFPAAPYGRLYWPEDASFFAVSSVFIRHVTLFFVLPIVMVLALGAAFVFVKRLTATERLRLASTAVLAMTFWTSVVSRPDLWHIAFAVPAVLLCLTVGVDLLWSHVRTRHARAVILTAVVALTTAMTIAGCGGLIGRRALPRSWRMPGSYRAAETKLVPCPFERCGDLRIDGAQRRLFGQILGAIERHSRRGDPILDLSDRGLLYFMS